MTVDGIAAFMAIAMTEATGIAIGGVIVTRDTIAIATIAGVGGAGGTATVTSTRGRYK